MKKIIFLALALLILAPAACNVQAATAVSSSKAGVKKVKVVKKFNNIAELKKFLTPLSYSSNYGYSRGAIMDTAVQSWSAPTAAMPSGAVAKTADYSSTNIQVAGVDESDIVKTDGDYIYALSRNNLQIIKARPAGQARVVTTIQFKNYPQDMYISDGKLVVFGNDYSIGDMPYAKTWIRRYGYTYVKIFDIANPAMPKLVRDLSFEGNYSDSRVSGGYLYFLTNYSSGQWLADGILPKAVDGGKIVSYGKTFPNVYYFDIPYRGASFTVLAAVSLKDNARPIKRDVYLMPDNQNLYVSANNFYLTYTKYFNEDDFLIRVTRNVLQPYLSPEENDRIAKISAIDGAILNDEEKLHKIDLVLQNYLLGLDDAKRTELSKKIEDLATVQFKAQVDDLEKTVIQKIAYSGDTFTYQGSVEVRGSLLNQFSMDEDNGYFRVATTKNRNWSSFATAEDNVSYSNVYILDKDLNPTGALEKLAKGERIYSARFMQGRAYLVTFQQVDPLFVIDVSNPVKPAVLGQLKVPGFSTYLHPYDEKTIIGFGRQTATTDKGQVVTKGLKISLFDVSDVANPKEKSTVELGGQGSDSPALYDHKAFMLAKSKNRLVIPVYLTKVGGTWGDYQDSGAAVFAIDSQKITQLGLISHHRPGATPYDWTSRNDNFYGDTVKRALYIEENLYTISDNYVKINNFSSLKDLKVVDLNLTNSDFNIINR
ncbi:MAG: beta-propeller domain-containing protein [Candidatus Falkowbacteria bacterium]